MTNTTGYPRDLTGYGATPPTANWPDGARIAVQIVLNYEEGGENNILHGDAASGHFYPRLSALRRGQISVTPIWNQFMNTARGLDFGVCTGC